MQRWYGIVLAGSLAGCTAATPPVEPTSIHDHFKSGLDTLVPQGGHPCGSDYKVGEYQGSVHFRYTYDSLDRLQTKIGVDSRRAPYERTDYTWDNAGHVTQVHDVQTAAGAVLDGSSLYDTLGRLTESRSSFSDLDPTDDHQIGNTRTTVTYQDFDLLGKPAHADQLDENLDAQTSQLLTQSYSYDSLGRQTSLEIRTATGDLYESEQVVYDDAALTVSWKFQPSPALADMVGLPQGIDHYDSDGRWLSRHQENLRADGTVAMNQDTVVSWDGDNELSEVMSIYPPDHLFTLQISTTYQYQCDPAPLAPIAQAAGALPRIPGAVFHRHR